MLEFDQLAAKVDDLTENDIYFELAVIRRSNDAVMVGEPTG